MTGPSLSRRQWLATTGALGLSALSGCGRPRPVRDSQGRVTYKGKVVQMYPIRRLSQLFKERLKYSGEEETQ